jgi:hypothetical protein
LSVTADAQSKVYGASDPTLTYVVSGLQFSDTEGAVVSGSLARAAGENVGTRAITVGTIAVTSNYSLSYVGADLTITAKPITVTAIANSKTTDGNPTAVALPVISSGTLVSGDTANFSETYDNANVGTGKTLTPGGSVTDGNSGNNYAVTFITNVNGIILTTTQVQPDSGTGAVTINATTPQVLITNPTQATTITIDSATTNPSIDVSSFITGGTGTLPAITITSANANNVNVAIPASTIVTSASTSWNGVIAAPTVTTVTLPATSGQTKTVSTAIEIGFTGAKLSFDKGIRLLLPGQAGKRAGYIRTGIEFTEITSACALDGQTTGDALAADGDCKIDVGSDLVIWTKHFTSFATYTQTTNPAPAPSGGGGGGGYSPPRFNTHSVDSNSDGKINLLDFNTLMVNWGITGSNITDFDGSGTVDLLDFNLLMINWTS